MYLIIYYLRQGSPRSSRIYLDWLCNEIHKTAVFTFPALGLCALTYSVCILVFKFLGIVLSIQIQAITLVCQALEWLDGPYPQSPMLLFSFPAFLQSSTEKLMIPRCCTSIHCAMQTVRLIQLFVRNLPNKQKRYHLCFCFGKTLAADLWQSLSKISKVCFNL